MLAELADLPAMHLTLIAGLFGLLVGSFLNVVILRYPKMLHYQWTAQSYYWLNKELYTEIEPPSLSAPPSHCPKCNTPIKPWQNIPVISWLWLKGKCAECKHNISIRYPLIELLTAIMTATVVFEFGWSIQSGFALLLTWALIILSVIDIDHTILPDDIVLPILWFGLSLNIVGTYTTLENAVIGCIAGYLVFWLVCWIFKLLTGKEGMGHGDFKLLALMGAWLGWQVLPQLILISTLLGSVVGIGLMVYKKAARDYAMPFGPFIAIGGWIALIWGKTINQLYFSYLL